MPDSLEEQQFRKWLRRPTLFIANAWYLLAAAGQYVISVIIGVIAAIAGYFGGAISNSGLTYGISTIYEIGILALPVIIYAAKHEGVGQSMRLNPPKGGTMIAAAATAFIGVLAVNNLGMWWMLLIEALGGDLYTSAVPVPTTVNELTSAILMVGVIPGICEELFFRGGLMGAWERRGTKTALVITSVLFALLHGTVLGLPTQLIMGFVLGYLLILSDSIYVSMIYHTVHNSSAMILAYIGETAAGSAAAVDPYLDMAGYIMSTGGFGMLIVQTIILTAMYIGALVLLSRSEQRSGRKLVKIVHGDESKMTWQELLVLIAGLITVGMAYFSDILTLCGVI